MEPVSLAIVEDERLLLSMLTGSLESSEAVTVAASFLTGAAAYHYANVPKIDVAVLDIDLGAPPDGVQVALEWRRRNPVLGIVFLTNLADPSILLGLPDIGRFGLVYLHKRTATSVASLVTAIEQARRGEVVIDPVVTADVPLLPGSLDMLTAHQQRILRHIAHGESNKRIALDLGIDTKAVENATAAALRTLGLDGTDPDVNVRVTVALAYLRLISGART